MADLIKPEINELKYRQKLHESDEILSNQQLTAFYKEYVDCDPHVHFYRLQYCPDCADFTGELGWNYNSLLKRYELFIYIQHDKRRDGYGTDGMKKLLKAAKDTGIEKLYAVVSSDNKEASSFFHHVGMHEEKSENKNLIFSQNTAEA